MATAAASIIVAMLADGATRGLLVDIDGEDAWVVKAESGAGYWGGKITLHDGREYTVFDDRESAGTANREYYDAMAHNEPQEFENQVGLQTIIGWAINDHAGYKRFLDEKSNNPEGHFASIDGSEVSINRHSEDDDESLESLLGEGAWETLEELLEFEPSVAYRTQ